MLRIPLDSPLVRLLPTYRSYSIVVTNELDKLPHQVYLPDGVCLPRRRHLDRRHAALQVVGEEERSGETTGGGGDRGREKDSQGGITTCLQAD